jgi:hypothetical protein
MMRVNGKKATLAPAAPARRNVVAKAVSAPPQLKTTESERVRLLFALCTFPTRSIASR